MSHGDARDHELSDLWAEVAQLREQLSASSKEFAKMDLANPPEQRKKKARQPGMGRAIPIRRNLSETSLRNACALTRALN